MFLLKCDEGQLPRRPGRATEMAIPAESDLSRLMRSIRKIVLFRRPAGSLGKPKSSEYSFSRGASVHSRSTSAVDADDNDDNEKLRRRAAMETLIAELFASVAAIKAEYAQLQVAQSPYDPKIVQASDRAIVSHLQRLSLLKHTHLEKLPVNGNKLLAELQEHRSLLKTFEITSKKLQSELEKKDSNVLLLKNQVSEAEAICRWMEENLRLFSRSPEMLDVFLPVLRRAVKSIRSFVRMMMEEMEAAGWDMAAAAGSIAPDVLLGRSEDRSFAFEAFVCQVFFSGFHLPDFGLDQGGAAAGTPPAYLEEFQELRDANLMDALRHRASRLPEFCRVKYLALVHPAMEASFFGGTEQRDIILSSAGGSDGGGDFPAAQFFLQFAEMARRVWLLHRLFFSLGAGAEVGVFQVGRGSRFSELYMESVVEDDGGAAVGFTVVPGFRLGKTIIQSKVYPVRAALDR